MFDRLQAAIILSHHGVGSSCRGRRAGAGTHGTIPSSASLAMKLRAGSATWSAPIP